MSALIDIMKEMRKNIGCRVKYSKNLEFCNKYFDTMFRFKSNSNLPR